VLLNVEQHLPKVAAQRLLTLAAIRGSAGAMPADAGQCRLLMRIPCAPEHVAQALNLCFKCFVFAKVYSNPSAFGRAHHPGTQRLLTLTACPDGVLCRDAEKQVCAIAFHQFPS
jgi:hypothetical protein